MEQSITEKLDAARKQFDGGEIDGAFHAVRALLAFPGTEVVADEDWRLAWELFHPILKHYVGDRLDSVVEASKGAARDPQALYDLGYQLIEVGLNDVAATALFRANKLVPNNAAILGELSTALERTGLYFYAWRVLAEAEEARKENFLLRYLLAFNALMAGRLTDAREAYTALGAPEDDTEAFLQARIMQFLERADTVTEHCPLDDKDLRGWHYVITGGLLTHLSPYGLDEPMHGRYAYLQDNRPLLREGILKLKAVLKAWEVAPEQVLFFPDRDSEVLGLAVAAELGLPAAELSSALQGRPGLYVAYHLNEVAWELLEPLAKRKPGQVLFAHSLNWTQDFAITPDVLTQMNQVIVSPWGEGRMKVDPDTQEVAKIPADDAGAEDLAATVNAAVPEEEPMGDLGAVEKLAGLVGAPGPEGGRGRYFSGGPVPSNRFA